MKILTNFFGDLSKVKHLKMGNRKQSYRFLHALWKENAKQNCCENLSERKGL